MGSDKPAVAQTVTKASKGEKATVARQKAPEASGNKGKIQPSNADDSTPLPTQNGFLGRMREALRNDGLDSITVRNAVVRIRVAGSLDDWHGVVPMTCVFAEAERQRVTQLRVAARNGIGWSYNLSERACAMVLSEVKNQRSINGRNSFRLFVEANQTLINGL